MVGLEGFKEFDKDLVFSLLARDDVGVAIDFVNITDVSQVKNARIINVNLIEGLFDSIKAHVVHFATKSI
jgi:anaerobic glycerol-3-phosphate dehydrogenase